MAASDRMTGLGDINMSRTRHAEEVRDAVDVEIILADTGRIVTDEMVISLGRAGILHHGTSKVKIVATKIDVRKPSFGIGCGLMKSQVISDNELAQCRGTVHDKINLLMQGADRDINIAEEQGEDSKMFPLTRYKTYLQRCKKLQMIQDRSQEISQKLGNSLQGPSPGEFVETFHTSTADYMKWIVSDKISFERQPALSPEETGVPKIRRFLFNLPASQNLRDHANHIDVVLPAFVDKLKRIVTQSDRDAGFQTIANDVDDLRRSHLGGVVKMLKMHYLSCLKTSVLKIKKDEAIYKDLVKCRVNNEWLELKGPALARLLKNRGHVAKGTSKARGLEDTVNWNVELAEILKPGFQKWFASHTQSLQSLRSAICRYLNHFNSKAVELINGSAANLVTVEKAKSKFAPLKLSMRSKVIAMEQQMLSEEKRLFHRVTLEDERENNLISAITDKIYDDVFMNIPEIKLTRSGQSRYVTPIIKFRKNRLAAQLLDAEDHFFDKVISLFSTQLEENMNGIIDEFFHNLNTLFDDFCKLLHEHAPIDYPITARGEAIRSELEKEIPYIEEIAEKLCGLLPLRSKEGDESSALAADILDDDSGQFHDLAYFLEEVKKRKQSAREPSRGVTKRIKKEPM